MVEGHEKLFGKELFRSIGHEMRTLLNSITGPVELIRAYSEDPRLIQPLTIIELSAYRFEKFSLRSLLITDILSSTGVFDISEINLLDTLRHIVLELDGFADFYKVKPLFKGCDERITAKGCQSIVYQSLQLVVEQALNLANPNTEVVFECGHQGNHGVKIIVEDSGLLCNKFNSFINSKTLPNEIELAFFALALDVNKNIAFTFKSTPIYSEVYITPM